MNKYVNEKKEKEEKRGNLFINLHIVVYLESINQWCTEKRSWLKIGGKLKEKLPQAFMQIG